MSATARRPELDHVTPSPIDRPPSGGASFEELQIELLLGGDAFRTKARRPITGVTDARYGRFSGFARRLLLLAILAAIVSAGVAVMKLGLTKRERVQREMIAADLRQLLRIGSYDHAAPLLAQLREGGPSASRDADLIALGQSLAYRFFDRDPERLAEVDRILAAGVSPAGPERVMAHAISILDQKPKEALAALRRVMDTERDDVNAALLLGIAASLSGERVLAERAFRRAEELEPPHLVSLFSQLDHWVRVENRTQALETLSRMTDVSPSSPWTELGRALIGEADTSVLTQLALGEDVPEAVRLRARETLGKLRAREP
jgi:tetratricopeptide (TPR) repeat protein